MPEKKDPLTSSPLVSIYCLAYNKQRIIKKTIEGILMQRTNFQFELIINDDASTDGTTDTIKEYSEKFPEIVKPVFQKRNQFKTDGFNFCYRDVYPKLSGKYVAVCDGDDVWIDPLKIQNQVNLIEENTIVHSTVCMRHDLFKQYLNEVSPEKRRDWHLIVDFNAFLWLIQHSKFKFIDDITTIYNVVDASISRGKGICKSLYWHENVYNIVEYFLKQYGDENLTNRISAFYTSQMINELLICKKWEGAKRGLVTFYRAKDWLKLFWLLLTLPFLFSPFLIKASYFAYRKLFRYKFKNV